MKTPLSKFMDEGWKLKPGFSQGVHSGDKIYTLTRHTQSPYGWFCPYSSPGFVIEEIEVTLNRGRFRHIRQTYYRQWWPYCDLEFRTTFTPLRIPSNWKTVEQLELLFLM